MKKSNGIAMVALAASAALLAACSQGSTSTTPTQSAGGTASPKFTYAYEQEFAEYNTGTVSGNSSKNAIPLNRVLLGFWKFAADGTIAPEPEFGSYTKTSDDPLTVEYTFSDKAVWSDGEPIDCDDAYLTWYASSGKTKAFKTAGTTGYDLIKSLDCADGDKKFTVTYSKPFADWEGLFGSFLPAQVLEKEAGVADFIAAVDGNDAAALAKAATFWSKGWVFQPGKLPDASLIPSSGPYKLSSWQAGNNLTLVANDKWWGTPAVTPTVVIRFIAGDAQAQALQNGEIQAMDPQPTPDLNAQLAKLGDAVTVENGDQFTYEHYDINFKGSLNTPELREAFALCLPRQTIVDNLIKVDNPEANVLNSRYFFPFQPQYDALASTLEANVPAEDVAAAKKILEDNKAVGTEIRLGYIVPNPRRSAEAQLVADACGQAGFKVIDEGNKRFFDADGALVNSDFDVALFAWAGSPLVTGSSGIYDTGGGSNFNNYSNATVDKLVPELNSESDKDAQVEIIAKIETELWKDRATIPVFTFPGLAAYGKGVEGVVYNATQAGLTWNMDEWKYTPTK